MLDIYLNQVYKIPLLSKSEEEEYGLLKNKAVIKINKIFLENRGLFQKVIPSFNEDLEFHLNSLVKKVSKKKRLDGRINDGYYFFISKLVSRMRGLVLSPEFFEEDIVFYEFKNLYEDLIKYEKNIHFAIDKFMNHNQRLSISLAKRYFFRHNSLSLNDLIQSANYGLFKSSIRFDVSGGYKFNTYASWWIRQSIRAEIINNNSIIRLPLHFLEDITKILKSKEILLSKENFAKIEF